MTVFGVSAHNKRGVNTAFVHNIDKHIAVRADTGGVIDFCACFCGGNGLIKTLSPGENPHIKAPLRFALGDNMVKAVNIVEIARPDI